MEQSGKILDVFADLLCYPAVLPQELLSEIRVSGAGLPNPDEMGDEVRNHLAEFSAQTHSMSLQEFEELYTRTFDINPVCSLEVGWHLYGEQYERGAFLVRMRELLRQYGVQESTELPDHLVHMLRVIGRMTEKDAQKFVQQIVLPALGKMIDGFKEKSNPYEHILTALRLLLETHYLQGVPSHV